MKTESVNFGVVFMTFMAVWYILVYSYYFLLPTVMDGIKRSMRSLKRYFVADLILLGDIRHTHDCGWPNPYGAQTEDGGHTMVLALGCRCGIIAVTKENFELCTARAQQQLLDVWRRAGYEPVWI